MITEDYVSFEGFVPIKGYEEYLISKEGKVYSPKTHKLLGVRDRGGYLAFTVCVNNKRKELFEEAKESYMWCKNHITELEEKYPSLKDLI